MRKPIINDRRMLELIDRQGMNQNAAAKTLGVSRQAVSKRIQELRGKTTRVVVGKESKRIVEQSFDAINQMNGINKKSLELLDQAEQDSSFALKCIAELRNQIRLAMDIQERIYSQQAAQDFMAVVVEIMKEVDTDLYEKFLKRINSEKSIRDALRFT